MCTVCGCGAGETRIETGAQERATGMDEHDHSHGHIHSHDNDHERHDDRG